MRVSCGEKGPPKGQTTKVAPRQADFEELGWLRQTKVTVPVRVPGYVDRPDLVALGAADEPAVDVAPSLWRLRQDHDACRVLPSAQK